MTQTLTPRFHVRAAGDGHGHTIEAASYEAAAVDFTETYAPPVDADNEIHLFVTRLGDGVEHCFTVDLGGAAEPCD